MNGVSRALLVATALLAPALSSAQETSKPSKSGLDYNYAELSYDKHDFDVSRAPDNIDGDGFTLSGSFKVADDWHVYASYGTANLDFGIGVDTDQYYTLPEAASQMISSAMKPETEPVAAIIKLTKNGNFPTGGGYYGPSGYAPFHDLDSKVPANVKTEMETILKGLQSGDIPTNVPPVKPG